MSSINSHLKIALESIKCFTDDGTLDLGELNYLLELWLMEQSTMMKRGSLEIFLVK